MPPGRGEQSLLEDGIAERRQQSGALHRVEEPGRGQLAPVGVVPAGQRLGGDHLTGGEVDDRLELDGELVLGDGAGQLGGQREPADVGGVAGAGVQGDGLAAALGLVHRDVGAA